MTPEMLDLATWPIFYRMSQRGLLVSWMKLDALLSYVRDQMQQEFEITQILAGRQINPMSGDDVAKWMIEQGMHGKKTMGGRLSTNERALEQHDHPLLDAVLEYRGLKKLETTFILPTMQAAKKHPEYLMHGGVVHPKWRLTKVRSGRVACEDPNLLAFPSRTELGKRMRSCFVARTGYKFVSVDYSQLEPRIAAGLSQDERLLKIYNEDRDLYTEVAADLGVSRTVAKTLTLGTLYGMGGMKLYESLIAAGCVSGEPPIPDYDLDKCEDLLEQWFNTYSGVKRLVAQTIEAAKDNEGWAVTVGGRGRLLPGLFVQGWGWPCGKIREEAERQCFNHLIQGTGMECLRKAMLAVDASPWGYYPLLAIHDELIYEVPAGDAEAWAKGISHTMEGEFHGVTLKTTASIADNWGELK